MKALYIAQARFLEQVLYLIMALGFLGSGHRLPIVVIILTLQMLSLISGQAGRPSSTTESLKVNRILTFIAAPSMLAWWYFVFKQDRQQIPWLVAGLVAVAVYLVLSKRIYTIRTQTDSATTS